MIARGRPAVSRLATRLVRGLLAWRLRRGSGPWGERVAARYLRRRGLLILARNFRAPSGELDIVALEGRTLVCVEVKTCATDTRARGLARIDMRKRRRLRRALTAFLRRAGRRIEGRFDSWRGDAVVVEYERLALWGRRVTSIDWHTGVF